MIKKTYDNELGKFLKRVREEKGYKQEDVCDGICSVSTLCRMEAGERITDYLLLQMLFSRMQVRSNEYEMLLSNDDFDLYEKRAHIEKLIERGLYEEAEECLNLYEKEKGVEEVLHRQYVVTQRAMIKKKSGSKDRAEICKLFETALLYTMKDCKNKLSNKSSISNEELICMAEMLYYKENSSEKKEGFGMLYEYFQWQKKNGMPVPILFFTVMQYYAEYFYEKEEYEHCVEKCDEALEALYKGGGVRNRAELFELRARAVERQDDSLSSEERKQSCLKDFLVAYHLYNLFGKEKKAAAIKEHLEKEYQWHITD